MKNHIIGISVTMLSAIGLVIILAWTALKSSSYPNGFIRIWASELQELSSIEKERTVVGICGATPHTFYFKTNQPNRVWVTNHQLGNGRYLSLNIPSIKQLQLVFNMIVDSPYVDIMGGNGPIIIKTNLEGNFKSIHRFPTAVFSRSVKISSNSYAFRGFDTTIKKPVQIFIKGNPLTQDVVRQKNLNTGSMGHHILSDGYLNYDSKTHLLSYVSFYNNQMLCLDTNLNLVYSSRTIDTVSKYKTTVGIEKTNTRGTISNAAPIKIINLKGRVYNGQLYNVSSLLADNEKPGNFNLNSPVDVYDVSSGKYIYSFYIPHYRGEKIFDFKVLNDLIIVVYRNYIVTYRKLN
jgi:hypothetical protein